MKVGDLVRMRANGSICLVMRVDGDDALLQNIKTSYRMWATWNLTHDRLNYDVVNTGNHCGPLVLLLSVTQRTATAMRLVHTGASYSEASCTMYAKRI